MKKKHGIYFDQKDVEILQLVNRILNSSTFSADGVLNKNLHPHGIKELVDTPVFRIAHAVVNLLRNLNTGSLQARDRLLGLRILYDEVLNSAHSTLRRNTARVLMQIMKGMVRAYGDEMKQLRLAHDFRAAANGTPRIVRSMLRRYHLPEMSEAWNQLAFDDHVYDMNTKGRKSPTHLIMDAWIKGLRTITVVYDNCVSYDVAEEVLCAAEIVGINVRIAVEYKVAFRGQFVSFLWTPRGFSSNDDFLTFLQSSKMSALSAKGREVVAWERDFVLRLLDVWNRVVRLEYEELYTIEIPTLSVDDFLNYVGRGQANKGRLAENIYKIVLPSIERRLEDLNSRDLGEEESILKTALEGICPDSIQCEWLNSELHPEYPRIDLTSENDRNSLPELRRLSPMELMRELSSINVGYRMILCTTSLYVQDVLELLWDCRGIITHLEIFNMRGWFEGHMVHIHEIGELQLALNSGQGPRLKQMVRLMIKDMRDDGDLDRALKFEDILRNVPMLWEHYRHTPLKSRIGTSSVSRTRSFGMGLVVEPSIPARGVRMLREIQGGFPSIPIRAVAERHVIYKEPEQEEMWERLLCKLRIFPGCSNLGREATEEWVSPRDDMRVCDNGNIANLGGLNFTNGEPVEDSPSDPGKKPEVRYLNSCLVNWIKVLLGFIPSFVSFLYTQNWWFLAWFGTFIWFGITGIRNVMQMVVAAKGLSRNTLIHWRDHVSIGRLCDSLLYTGISVFLLEVMVRVWLLEEWMGISVEDQPTVVFTVLNIVNGFYIFAHNIYRGFPKEAAIGNLFRSALAIPVSSVYNICFWNLLTVCGVGNPAFYLVPSAAVISKLASDTVAAIIEGFADSRMNMRIRHWDYQSKLQSIFDCYTRLELLFPQEDALVHLARPGGLCGRGGVEAKNLERTLIVNALDLMFFWYYQPRAQDAFRQIIRGLTPADRTVVAISQLILMREREVSQLMVDGLVGRSFARPLAFFLSRRKEYVRGVIRLCRPSSFKSFAARKKNAPFGRDV